VELQAPGTGLQAALGHGGPFLKLSYKRRLSLVFAVAAFLSFLSAAFFIFQLVAGLSSDLAARAAGNAAQLAFARMVARDRAVGAAAQAIAFLSAQGLLQVIALVLTTRIATRGLDAEVERMRGLIREQSRSLEEAAALSGWREVASFLSHQLKNPLAAIDLSQSNAREALALMSGGPSGEAKGRPILEESLAAIAEETDRLKTLISRLKSLTAFQEPVFSSVDLGELARLAASPFPPERAKVRVSGSALARLDPELVRQAIRNLIDNSVEEAQKSDALPASVDIEIAARDGCAEALVRDSNGGMDGETAARLGNTRYTTKKTGSGLGLIFVSRIAAIHGGSFQAGVSPKGGLEIRLRFPPGPETGGKA
jgi:signal transduction histidine kinase